MMKNKPAKLAFIFHDWKDSIEVDELNKAIKYIGGEVRIKEVESGDDNHVYCIHNVNDKVTPKYLEDIWDSYGEDEKLPKGVKIFS